VRRSLTARTALLAALSAIGALGACTAGTPTPTAPAPSSIQPRGAHASHTSVSVYVTADSGSGTYAIYGFRAQNRKDNRPDCTLSGEGAVEDIAADSNGNVYVPVEDGSTGKLLVYAPACGRLMASLSDSYGSPVGAAVSGDTIYVANAVDIAVCTISAGCTSQLTDSSIAEITSTAVDSQDNVWAAYYAAGKGGIGLIFWPGGTMPGKVVSGYIESGDPGDISFDRSGNLLALELDDPVVYTFSCSTQDASCTKTTTSSLQPSEPQYGALNARNSDFQVTDGRGAVDVYAYPSFTYEYSYDRGPHGDLAAVGITQASR
jgi:hypothetical protein